LKTVIHSSLCEWYNPLYLSDKRRYVAGHMMPQLKDVVTQRFSATASGKRVSGKCRSPELLTWLYNESPVKAEVVVNDRWGGDTRHKYGGYWTTECTPGMAETSNAFGREPRPGLQLRSQSDLTVTQRCGPIQDSYLGILTARATSKQGRVPNPGEISL